MGSRPQLSSLCLPRPWQRLERSAVFGERGGRSGVPGMVSKSGYGPGCPLLFRGSALARVSRVFLDLGDCYWQWLASQDP